MALRRKRGNMLLKGEGTRKSKSEKNEKSECKREQERTEEKATDGKEK